MRVKARFFQLRWPRPSLLLVPFLVTISFWLGGHMTASLSTPGEAAARLISQKLKQSYGIHLSFQSARAGILRGLVVSGVRFSRESDSMKLTGSIDSLWIQPSWKKKAWVAVFCHAPHVQLTWAPQKKDPAPIRFPENVKMFKNLPSIMVAMTQGAVHLDAGKPVDLTGLTFLGRTDGSGTFSCQLDGRTQGWGDGQWSLWAGLSSQVATASLKVRNLDLAGVLQSVGIALPLSGQLDQRMDATWDPSHGLGITLDASLRSFASPWISQDEARVTASALFPKDSQDIQVTELTASLPGMISLKGSASVRPQEKAVNMALESATFEMTSLARLKNLSILQDISGSLTLSQGQLAWTGGPESSLHATSLARLEKGSWCSKRDSVALDRVNGDLRLVLDAKGSDAVVSAEGNATVGAFWLDDFDVTDLAVQGAVEIGVPSGLLRIRQAVVQVSPRLAVKIEPSWVVTRDGQMDLSFSCDSLSLDQASEILPKSIGRELAAFNLAGVGSTRVRVSGYPSAERTGLGDRGTGMMHLDIHADLAGARARYEDLECQVGGTLSSDIRLAFAKSGAQVQVDASGNTLEWSYRGVPATSDQFRLNSAFRINSAISQIIFQDSQLSLGNDLEASFSGVVRSSLTNLHVTGSSAPIDRWRQCLPLEADFLSGVKSGNLEWDLKVSGWQGRSLSLETRFSGLDYQLTGTPPTSFRADQLRVLLDPLGVPGASGQVVQTSCKVSGSACSLVQQGRVTFEGKEMTGQGTLWMDRSAEHVRIPSFTFQANQSVTLNATGHLQRSTQGYEGILQMDMPGFKAEDIAGVLPSLRTIDLRGALSAKGELTLGEGSRIEEVRGILKTQAPLTFKVTRTLYEGFEGELPFVQSFTGQGEAPDVGELRAKQIAVEDTYVFEHPVTRGYYLDGAFVAQEAEMGFCGGQLKGGGHVSPFDNVPFAFDIRFNGARMDELVTRVSSLVGDVFVGTVEGQISGSGEKDGFTSLSGHVESKGGWMSTSKIMDLLDQFPGQRLIDVLQVPMKLLGGLKLEVEIYEEEGVPRYRYGIIDPVGIVKNKGEALLSMPMDILRVFMRQSEPSESP